MEVIKLNKNSWHFRVARIYGCAWNEDLTNICSYLKVLGRGLLIICFIVGAVSVWLGGVIDFLIWLSLTDNVPVNQYGIIMTIATAIIIVLALSLIWVDYKTNQIKIEIEKEPSIVRLAYQRFKDKICVKLEFE